MARKSVYLPDPAVSDRIIRVTGDEHHHLSVARVETGEKVEVFDGRDRVWLCEVLEVANKSTSVRVIDERHISAPAIKLILGLALIQRSAFELALEKAVEAGVTRIIPFVASRSNVAPGERSNRWQRIVIEAAKQSKRFHLPVMDSPVKFEDVLQIPATTRILFAEHGGGPLKLALAGSPVLYLVGPEGGWNENELKSATVAGFRLVSLGHGILRSETAALTGAFLIRYELGDI